MARVEHYVLEKMPSSAFDCYDVVCPKCCSVLREAQERGRRISTKCSGCNAWVSEYSAIAVESGRAGELSQSKMEHTLTDYWEFEPDDRNDEFAEAARELRLDHLFTPAEASSGYY